MRKYLRISLSEKEASWEPWIQPATDKYIRPILGDVLLAELDDDYNAESHEDELETLLPYVQAPLAKFIMFLAVPNLDLQVSEGGFTVNNTQSQSPASRERVLAFQSSLEGQGWDAIETLLRFLESNIDDYPTWETSDQYTLAIRNLVNSAETFDKYYGIDKSRLVFNRYRAVMDSVDLLVIKPAISENMFDVIMAEIKAGSVSTSNAKVLPLLQGAEVFGALAENMDKAKYEGVGVEINTKFFQQDQEKYRLQSVRYLNAAIDVMRNSPDDYPEYRDSDSYQTAVEPFENDEENGVFVFGSTY